MSKNPLKYLTEAQVQFFHDNGYLLVENFSSPAEVVKMRQEAELIMERLEKEQNLPVHVFSTGSNQVRSSKGPVLNTQIFQCLFSACGNLNRLVPDNFRSPMGIFCALSRLRRGPITFETA
jgi:hypothetical protein